MHVAARVTGYSADKLRARIGLVRRRGYDGAIRFLAGLTPYANPFDDVAPLDAGLIGWVYRAECEDEPVIKIGLSRDPEQRMQDLRRKYGPRMKLISVKSGTMLDEFAEHRRLRFAGACIVGEWFWRDDADRAAAMPDFLLSHYSPAMRTFAMARAALAEAS
jgi:hypothetical protein